MISTTAKFTFDGVLTNLFYGYGDRLSTTAKFTFDDTLTSAFITQPGLTAATVAPSSDTRLMFTHQGLTAVNVLPLAGIVPSYVHAGLVAVNVIPVAKWFFAPPPGVPQYMFSVPREADFYVR